ncbi:alginate export family protein [Blastomonas sp. AAP53]|uniref:alginate export family protein n=1 Tax=Blastomonas sp. AAP53 TaxID=1248760 RepID=UPI000477B31B|nr:alginate export family protein [Blastomonas sp. AAP53]
MVASRRMIFGGMFVRTAALSGMATAAALIAAPAPAHAQSEADNGLTLSGSYRLRYEMLEAQYRPGLPPRDDAITLQTLIVADYRSGPWHLSAELVDARGYLIDAPGAASTGEVNAFELSRASISYRHGPFELTAGRLHLNLGSRRLAARNAFRNTINSFTGVRVDWHGQAEDTLTAFYVLPHTRLPSARADLVDNRVRWDRESFDLTFWGAHYTRPDLFDGITLQTNVFGLNERDGDNGPTRNRRLITWGARLHRAPALGRWDIDMEGAVQTGTIRQSVAPGAARQDVRAFFGHAELGYSPDLPGKPRLSVLFDIASGDDPRSASFTRFDTLFGARRWEFGPSGLFGALARTNIISPGVRAEVRPAPRWDAMALWRPAWVHDRRDRFGNAGPVDPQGQSGRFAGHLLEVRLGHWLIEKRLRLEAGTAIMTGDRLLDDAPNATGFGDTRYAYGQMTVNF